MTCIGIEIGGTKLQLVTGDERGRILNRERVQVDPAAGAESIRRHIASVLPRLVSESKAAGIGVGFGGPVAWRTGRICRSHHVEGWSEFDLKSWLQGLSGLPVRVDNDANVAALGEARHGAGVGRSPCFYVTLGSGVGGGLVVDGEIYHGAAPGEAEIGHVRLDRQGTIVEARCSGWAVDRRIREITRAEPQGLLAKLTAGMRRGEAARLGEAIAAGDASALRLLAETAADLAFGLSHVAHLFHPEVIVLGGGLSGLGEPLRKAVADALPGFLMEAFAPGPEVALAALREDAVPVGALVLAASGQSAGETRP